MVALIDLVIEQSGRCAYCGIQMQMWRYRKWRRVPRDAATLDHIIPKCRGGKHRRDNLVAACYGCNNEKGALTGEEFMMLKAARSQGSRETALLQVILAGLWDRWPNGLWYRRNVGAVKTEQRFIRFGLPGMADIGGILGGRAVEVEVKAAFGRQTEDQKNWQRAVERAGGIYILGRSLEGVIDQINARL